MKPNTSIFRSLAIFAVLLTLLSGCQKKVLELQPYSSFSDASAFADAAKVNLAVNGVYDAAQSGFYAGGAVRGYPFGAASIQQGDMRGEAPITISSSKHCTHLSIRPTWLWKALRVL
jgi:hypothetical protein